MSRRAIPEDQGQDDTAVQILNWLSGDPQGRSILQKLADRSELGIQLLLKRLNALDVPANIKTVISGGTIQKFVNIAQTDTVSINFRWPYPEIRDYHKDFGDLIRSLSDSFVGRAAFFQALKRFQSIHKRGYFRVIADAGLGKTALAARVADKFHAPAFFVNRSKGLARADQCLNHLSVEVIASYGLDRDHIPADAGHDSSFFGEVLGEAVGKAGSPIWVVIDALDEADDPLPGQNTLFLPHRLPDGVYIILTHRPGPFRPATDAGTANVEHVIRWDDPDQSKDVTQYVKCKIRELPAVRQILAAGGGRSPRKEHELIGTLVAKSEGNFKYLEYLFESLSYAEHNGPVPSLDDLPQGLRAYYDQFWARIESIKAIDGWDTWDTFYRPTVARLGVAREPVSVRWIADQLGCKPTAVRERILLRWRPLLNRTGEGEDECWRVVHQSFADYLADKVDLLEAHHAIADYYLAERDRWSDHGRYASRHLSVHLRLARDHDRLFALMDDSAWYDAQTTVDPSGSTFANDVSQCQQACEALNLEAVRHGKRPLHLAREVNCALAGASLRNLSQNYPRELLVELVVCGLWDYTHALQSIRHLTDPTLRVPALSAMAKHVPETERHLVFDSLLKDLSSIDPDHERANSLQAVLPTLPSGYERILEERVAEIRDVYSRCRALATLVAHASGARRHRLIQETLSQVPAIHDTRSRLHVLLGLLPSLTLPPRENVAREVVDGIRPNSGARLDETMDILADLIPFLSHRVADRALVAGFQVAGLIGPRARGKSEPCDAPLAEAHLKTALAKTRTIEDELSRMRVLATLAPLLALCGHPQMAIHALDDSTRVGGAVYRGAQGVRAIGFSQTAQVLPKEHLDDLATVAAALRHAAERAQALILLSKHFKQPYRKAMLQSSLHALESCDADSRVSTIRWIAGKMPAATRRKAVRQAVQAVLRLPDSSRRFETLGKPWLLSQLSPYLPMVERKEVVDEAYQLARRIGHKKEQVQASVSILRALPISDRGTFLPGILANAWGLHEPRERVRLLTDISALAPAGDRVTIVRDILEDAKKIADPTTRAWALSTVIPSLKGRLRQAAVRDVLRDVRTTGWDEDTRCSALTSVLKYLSDDQLEDAFGIACKFRERGNISFSNPRSRALKAIAPYLTESMFGPALDTARRLRGWHRDQTLTVLAEHIPLGLLTDGLKAAAAIKDVASRESALVKLIPRLPHSERKQRMAAALKEAHAVPDAAQRAECLAQWFSIVPIVQRAGLVRDIFDAIILTAESADRAGALGRVIPLLSGEPQHKAFGIFLENLDESHAKYSLNWYADKILKSFSTHDARSLSRRLLDLPLFAKALDHHL